MSLISTLAALAGSSDNDSACFSYFNLDPPSEDKLYTNSLSVPGTPYCPDHPTIVPGPIARPSGRKAAIGLGLGLPTVNRVIPRYQQRRVSCVSERRAPLVKAGIIPSPNPQGKDYPTVPSGVPGWPDLLVINDDQFYDGEDNAQIPPVSSTSSSATLADSWEFTTIPPKYLNINDSAYIHYIHEADDCHPIPQYLNAPSPRQLPSPRFYTPDVHQMPFLAATPPYSMAPPPEDLPAPMFYPQPVYSSFSGPLTADSGTNPALVVDHNFRPFSPADSEDEAEIWATKPLNPNAALFHARAALIYETSL